MRENVNPFQNGTIANLKKGIKRYMRTSEKGKERFKVRPESAPVIKGQCSRLFVKKIEEPLTPKQLDIYVEADKVFNAIKPRKR